jgi:AcrR family transcriptional regulator
MLRFMASASESPNRRDRLRAQALSEITEHAMAILDTSGAEAVTLAAIAKAMGMSAPGLYRYFPSRDALIDRLVLLVHEELAAVLEETSRSTTALAPEDRLRSLAGACRRWALRYPMRYDAIFGATVRGATDPDGHPDRARAASAAKRGMGVLIATLADPRDDAADTLPTSTLGQQLLDWHRSTGGTTSPHALHLAIVTWTRLHGIISLEISGAFDAIGVDPALLLANEIDALLAIWRPVPTSG